MTLEQVSERFRAAILRINGKKIGTGFLVDAERGYVLTAAHNVQGAKAIEGTTSGIPGRAIKLKTVDIHTKKDDLDVALLVADPPDALAMLSPIEISFRSPKLGATAYALGYSRAEDVPSPRSVNLKMEGGSINTEGDFVEGDSGGPLFSTNGTVIGIARALLPPVI